MLHDTHGCWILIYCSFPLLLLLLFQVDALRGVGVRQIACGSGHTVVLTTDGEGTVTGNANFSMVVLPFLTVEYMFRRYFCKLKSTHGAEEMMVD